MNERTYQSEEEYQAAMNDAAWEEEAMRAADDATAIAEIEAEAWAHENPIEISAGEFERLELAASADAYIAAVGECEQSKQGFEIAFEKLGGNPHLEVGPVGHFGYEHIAKLAASRKSNFEFWFRQIWVFVRKEGRI